MDIEGVFGGRKDGLLISQGEDLLVSPFRTAGRAAMQGVKLVRSSIRLVESGCGMQDA